MRGGTVEIRYNGQVINGHLTELEISYEVGQAGVTYRIQAIENRLTQQLISEEENHMSDLQTIINNAELDETTKMLREQGVEDATGARTTLGTGILVDMLYKEKRAEIAAKVRATLPKIKPTTDEIND